MLLGGPLSRWTWWPFGLPGSGPGIRDPHVREFLTSLLSDTHFQTSIYIGFVGHVFPLMKSPTLLTWPNIYEVGHRVLDPQTSRPETHHFRGPTIAPPSRTYTSRSIHRNHRHDSGTALSFSLLFLTQSSDTPVLGWVSGCPQRRRVGTLVGGSEVSGSLLGGPGCPSSEPTLSKQPSTHDTGRPLPERR